MSNVILDNCVNKFSTFFYLDKSQPHNTKLHIIGFYFNYIVKLYNLLIIVSVRVIILVFVLSLYLFQL